MAARVLVVDDSPTIRKLVSAILARHDYEAAQAPDGQAGLDRLRQGGVDLVLLDFVMPRMNGYQFCREMRADETLRHLPVVLMSAKGDKIRGQFVQQTGAIDAITKPFDARGLLAVVEGALQKTDTLEIKQIIYNLIETHLSNATLAKTRADYAFRVIDPATVPDSDDYVRPKPLLFIAISMLLGPVLGFLLALLRESWTQSR